MATVQQLQQALTDAQAAYATALQAASAAQQAQAQAQTAFDAAVHAGLSDGTVGPYSSIDTLLQAERTAGKSAVVDYIKSNPTCTQAEAVAAWSAAGLAATKLPALIQDPNELCAVYGLHLQQMGAAPDASWASLAAWIVATDKAIIMEA